MAYRTYWQMAVQLNVYHTLLLIALSTICLYGEPVVVSGGPENDYESWIIRTNDNRLMVIFCRNPDWQSGDLCATFSTDNGASWGTPTVIIEGPGDQATLSFAQLPGDTFRLWYASNEGATYGIYTAHSFNGTSWERDGSVNLGWTSYDMHYDPTVIIEPDSSLTMAYRGPGGAYIAHKPFGGTWDSLRTLVGPSGYRPRVMKHTDGTYLYAYHRATPSGYEVFVRTSLDRINWTDELRMTFEGNSHDPFPNETDDGAYLIYYATHSPPAYNLNRRRSYDAVNWEAEEQITFDFTNNTQPHFFVELAEIYLVWAHAVSFPSDHDVYFERTPDVGVDDTVVSISDNMSNLLAIQPNPCTYRIDITNLHNQDITGISIYDIQGKKIRSLPHRLSSTSNCLTINISGLPSGVYFLSAQCIQGTICRRFVVAR